MTLATTVLDEFALAYSKSKLDVNEHRLSNYGAFATFLKDTPNLIPGYAELVANRTSAIRTVRIPVIQRETYTTGSSRSCDAETKENTSTYVTPSWTTIETGFAMYPSIYRDNYIAYQDDFNRKMEDVQRTFLTALDTAGYTHLNTNKSAVNNADGNPYTVAANAMIVPEADSELVFNELGAIMEQNDLMGPYNVVGSTRASALVRFLLAQGAQNDENTAFQFGPYSLAYSNRVTVPTGYRDSLFCMPIGSLAYLSWVDIDSQMGNKSSDGKEWMQQYMPLLGHNVGVLVQSTCSNYSSTITGMEATLKQSWNFSFDYSFNSAYNSDSTTLPGSIFRADISKT